MEHVHVTFRPILSCMGEKFTVVYVKVNFIVKFEAVVKLDFSVSVKVKGESL